MITKERKYGLRPFIYSWLLLNKILELSMTLLILK